MFFALLMRLSTALKKAELKEKSRPFRAAQGVDKVRFFVIANQ